MREYTFESLKRDALSTIPSYPPTRVLPELHIRNMIDGKRSTMTELYKEYTDDLRNAVESWDIRNIKGLVELYPSIISKKYLSVTPEIYLNERDKWMVLYSEVN